MTKAPFLHHSPPLYCSFDIYQGKEGFRERKQEIHREGHAGSLYEMNSPDGISLGYYNIRSIRQGQVVIDNRKPFIQCSYTISGNKSYTVNKGKRTLASFSGQEYNFLFFNEQEICLNWQPEERLEIFELGISPELFVQHLPEEHPFCDVFQKSLVKNRAVSMSKLNMPLPRPLSDILYHMLRCPLDGRYKQLFIKSKTIELMAYQLEQYEQMAGVSGKASINRELKKADIERMHHAHNIIMANLNSPCSLIDLAHQVGTNEAYLKKQFKQVYGNTVFGYLMDVKMKIAKEMLADGKPVWQVEDFVGYKYAVSFARAFKKHFGYPPGKITP